MEKKKKARERIVHVPILSQQDALKRCFRSPSQCEHLRARGVCGLYRKATFTVEINGQKHKQQRTEEKHVEIRFVESCPVGRSI